ncbi:hypothetical protein [Ideonella sp. A 288]|uniref:hypothetical protein n=1 Tax=Ideonella sp. A 288 TaxID=1962181 RepID=UPI000B4BF47F|nr:hypothetical protein [Ideonella sp. A 288]
MSRQSPPLPTGFRADIPAEDWELLFGAVLVRLQLTVDDDPGRLLSGSHPAPHCRIQSTVVECIAALEQLHSALSREARRRAQLEQSLQEVTDALARALSSPLGSAPIAGPGDPAHQHHQRRP